jgi:rhomboid protease GluP
MNIPPSSSDHGDLPQASNNGQPKPAGAPSANPTQGQIVVRVPQHKPFATYTIIGITVVVFLLQIASQTLNSGQQWPLNDLPYVWGAKVYQLIVLGEYWRLITPVLLHASPTHILLNMYSLFVLGPGLEKYYGHGRFVGLYLIAAFAGNVASFTFAAKNSISVGASTAIFGLAAAQAVFIYQNRKLFGNQTRRMLTSIGTVIAINLVLGFAIPSIDYWGHLGGLLGGTVFAGLAGPSLKLVGTPPELSLVDETTATKAWSIGLLEFLLFSIAAAAKIF